MKQKIRDKVGIAEAARRMKVTLKYVYDLVQAGKLGAQKVDGVWHIPVTAIDARIKQMEVRQERVYTGTQSD